jgi:hypothetical protein
VQFTVHKRWDTYPVEYKTASVLPLLVFADHVQVKYGPCGYTVDASNFVRLVRRGPRHMAADSKVERAMAPYPHMRNRYGFGYER